LLASITNASARTPIDQTTLTKVRANAITSSQKSWEVGTLTEALLEYSWPRLSVFNDNSIPPARQLSTSNYPDDVVKIVADVVAKKSNNSLPLVQDDTVGDPASIGPAVLLANWTRNDISDNRFSVAAGGQLNYILNYSPHTDDGAISHRIEQVQLWSDFVYMVPPFIAYFGAYESGDAKNWLLQSAYDQCRLYRKYLQDSATKLWKHIELGSWQDEKLWATGNGWAAAGMTRVLQTVRNSDVSGRFLGQQDDLLDWIEEIVKASWNYQTSTGALRNVINDSDSFEDTASTALMASVTFRLAVLKGENPKYIPNANAAYDFVHRNIDSGGWLRNTVDPLTFYTPSNPDQPSPEGQSFVLLLEAARRDFQDWAATLPSGGAAGNHSPSGKPCPHQLFIFFWTLVTVHLETV
jgi:rhamnogalacturonyl hydrolase YesR